MTDREAFEAWWNGSPRSDENGLRKAAALAAWQAALAYARQQSGELIVPQGDVVGISIQFADGHKEKAADVIEEVLRYRARQQSGDYVMVPREAVERIEEWSKAYPTSIFHEPTEDEWKQLNEAAKQAGLGSIDAFSASNMRHVITNVRAMMAAAPAQQTETKPFQFCDCDECEDKARMPAQQEPPRIPTSCGYCTYEEADGELIEQCPRCKAADAQQEPPQQAEPVAWMVYTQDGKSVFVTDNPTDIPPNCTALPLFTESKA